MFVRAVRVRRGQLGRDHVQPIRFVHAFPAVCGPRSLAGDGVCTNARILRRCVQEIDQLKADFETLRQQYAERLSALEARLASLNEARRRNRARCRRPGRRGGASKVFNPDISVIGNFVGVAGKEPDERAAVAVALRG